MLYIRKIQEKIRRWLLKEEVILLNGARQVGKTSLLKLLKQDLKKSGIEEERIFYFNLENFDILNDFNKSPLNLLNYITIKDKKNYFLIDEVQYLDNPSNFLKYLYDEHRDKVKLIATGSSSLELKAKLQDSLVGRKIMFMIEPLCFEEFLSFQQSDILTYYNKEKIPQEIQNKFITLLNEYLLFGGLPKIVLTKNIDEKQVLLKSYVNDYINKDIRSIGKINSVLQFNQLVKILAGQIGGLLNIHELTNTLRLSRSEIENYLELLECTFVLNRIKPYYKNVRSQITKMNKIYFFDLGIRNQILNNFSELNSRTDNGRLFENLIYLELKQETDPERIFFYRTIHKAEIDFVFEKDNIIYPIEVKYRNYYEPVGNRVLNNFCKVNIVNCPYAYLVNLNLSESKDKIIFTTFVNLFSKMKI